MIKNKIVVFDKNTGRARVYVTRHPDSIVEKENEVKLINPELSYVNNVPPEFWELRPDGQIHAVFDEQVIEERLAQLKIKPFIDSASEEIKEKLVNLVNIPGVIGQLQKEMVTQFLDGANKSDAALHESARAIQKDIEHLKDALKYHVSWLSGEINEVKKSNRVLLYVTVSFGTLSVLYYLLRGGGIV